MQAGLLEDEAVSPFVLSSIKALGVSEDEAVSPWVWSSIKALKVFQM